MYSYVCVHEIVCVKLLRIDDVMDQCLRREWSEMCLQILT